MNTLDVLQEMLMKDLSLERTQVGPDVVLSTLGIDSLDFIDFFFRIEDRFGLKLRDDIPATLVTLNDVACFIDSLIAMRESTPVPSDAQSVAIE